MSAENEVKPDTDSSADNDIPVKPFQKKRGWLGQSLNPFRIATLRGLAVVLPPLLTIILFFWAWNTIERAILQPAESAATYLIGWGIDDTLPNEFVQKQIATDSGARLSTQDSHEVFVSSEGNAYCQVGEKSWIPFSVFDYVDRLPGDLETTTPKSYYHAYIQSRFLKRHLVLPAFLAAFIAILYLIGKLIAAGIGRILWRTIESLIERLPIIRNVYSSVKQVTDFAFTENELQFNRVVAVEYPRKGIWSMGFVTGESMLEIKNAAGEPVLSVLMPTSPMPATGFTISVPKSETIDLNITIDQAVQFCVSCGVVVPDHQQAKAMLEGDVRKRLAQSKLDSTPDSIPRPESSSTGETQRGDQQDESDS